MLVYLALTRQNLKVKVTVQSSWSQMKLELTNSIEKV